MKKLEDEIENNFQFEIIFLNKKLYLKEKGLNLKGKENEGMLWIILDIMRKLIEVEERAMNGKKESKLGLNYTESPCTRCQGRKRPRWIEWHDGTKVSIIGVIHTSRLKAEEWLTRATHTLVALLFLLFIELL